ncbi:MAG: hypothetical protein AB7O62_05510 [Pirellulales bacterium]
MPVTVSEKWESRPTQLGDSPGCDLIFVIDGTDDDVEAHDALVGVVPPNYVGLVLQTTKVERVAELTWEGTAHYGKKEQAGESEFNFDTGGGTQHITQSFGTASYSASGPAPDYQGAIGVTPDAVEGVDITVPVYNFGETHYFDDEVVTPAYKSALFFLTGKVNASGFRGFAAGEVLFLGASGSQRGDDPWQISYRFAASPNVSGLAVGEIGGIDKGGWDYLWVRYEDVEDDDAKALVKRPLAAYVEQVYPFGNFAGLGIGT